MFSTPLLTSSAPPPYEGGQERGFCVSPHYKKGGQWWDVLRQLPLTKGSYPSIPPDKILSSPPDKGTPSSPLIRGVRGVYGVWFLDFIVLGVVLNLLGCGDGSPLVVWRWVRCGVGSPNPTPQKIVKQIKNYTN